MKIVETIGIPGLKAGCVSATVESIGIEIPMPMTRLRACVAAGSIGTCTNSLMAEGVWRYHKETVAAVGDLPLGRKPPNAFKSTE